MKFTNFLIPLILLQALNAGIVTTTHADPAEHLTIIVSTQANDSRGHGSLPLDDLHIANQLKKIYPESESVTISGTTNQQIHDELVSLMASRQDALIDALYVVAHGGTVDWTKVQNGENYSKTTDGENASIIFNESKSFSAILNQENSVQETFGPVIGRFSDQARLIFSSCETVGDNEAKDLKVMKDVSNNFQLKNGYLYMSRTDDSSIDDILLNEPTSQLPDQTEEEQAQKFQALVAHASRPISAPILSFIADHVVNQGYVLEVKNGQAKIVKTTRPQVLSKDFN